jgi:hypothetical protein
VPLSSNVLWPSAAALKLCHRELDQSGLLSKMRLGDLVENLAVSFPIRTSTGIPSTWTTGAMVYLPPYLHPLSTAHSSPLPLPSSHTPHNEIIKLGHLPPTLDSFLLPPTYFHAVLPTPYIIHLDLSRWAREVQGSLRLAHQRTEMSTVRGEVMSVEVWVHEAGFMIRGTDVGQVGPWEGSMVTLEADGTAEVGLSSISPLFFPAADSDISFRPFSSINSGLFRVEKNFSNASEVPTPSANHGRSSVPNRLEVPSGSSTSSLPFSSLSYSLPSGREHC